MKKIFLLCILLSAVVSRAEIENVFSTPGFKGQYSFTIENKLIEMTRMAVPGSTIRAALYSFDRVALADPRHGPLGPRLPPGEITGVKGESAIG